jgi:hypothetical protein
MNPTFNILLLIILLFGCNKKTSSIGKNVIKKQSSNADIDVLHATYQHIYPGLKDSKPHTAYQVLVKTNDNLAITAFQVDTISVYFKVGLKLQSESYHLQKGKEYYILANGEYNGHVKSITLNYTMNTESKRIKIDPITSKPKLIHN